MRGVDLCRSQVSLDDVLVAKQESTQTGVHNKEITRVIHCEHAYCDSYTWWLVQSCVHLVFRLFSTCLNIF